MPVVVPPRPAPLGRRTLLASVKPFANPLAQAAANYTFSLLVSCEADFDAVRLVYLNGTNSAYTIGAAAIAPCAAPGNGYSPLDGAGGAVPFTAVTFGSGGAGGPLPAAGGGVASFTVPANALPGSGPDITPTFHLSDWIARPSLPATGGETRRFLMVRTFVSSGSPSMVVATPASDLKAAWPSVSGGRVLVSSFKSGNVVGDADPSGWVSPAEYVTPVAVQFHTRRRGVTLLDIGDSLTQGLGSTSGHASAGHLAALAVSTPDRPVHLVNLGYAGQRSEAFATNGRVALDAFTPDVAALAVYTSNDPGTAAGADAAFLRATALAQLCLGRGIAPILKTGMPHAGGDGARDALRRAINARTRALAPAIPVADLDAAVTDGGNPARLRSAFDSGDGVHLNDAGHAACGRVLAATLRTVLAGL